MRSRYLARLEDRIAAAVSPVARWCAGGERIVYLTRRGEPVDEAMRELEAFARSCANASVSFWRHLAEAVHDYYHGDGKRSVEKALRAHALAAAAGQQRLQASAAAWLAHFHDHRSDPRATVLRAREALTLAAADDHQARARASLVLGHTLCEGGRDDLADPWYEKARHHAVADGDDSTLDASVWNRAMARFTCWRNDALRSGGQPSPATSEPVDLASAARFEPLFGIRTLADHSQLTMALLAGLQGRFGDAVEAYAGNIAATRGTVLERWRSALIADQAFCLASLGRFDEARTAAAQAMTELSADVHTDELAATHSRLADAFALLGEGEVAAGHRAQAGELWLAHDARRRRLIETYLEVFAGEPEPGFVAAPPLVAAVPPAVAAGDPRTAPC